MTTLFEQQGVQYEMQGDYKLPCVTLPNNSNHEIGVWGERHRRYLKEHHRVRYYNFLTAGTLDKAVKSEYPIWTDCFLEFTRITSSENYPTNDISEWRVNMKRNKNC